MQSLKHRSAKSPLTLILFVECIITPLFTEGSKETSTTRCRSSRYQKRSVISLSWAAQSRKGRGTTKITNVAAERLKALQKGLFLQFAYETLWLNQCRSCQRNLERSVGIRAAGRCSLASKRPAKVKAVLASDAFSLPDAIETSSRHENRIDPTRPIHIFKH